ncbi:MAG TPA: PIG-L family deacetylase [Acidocella sp.]|nr:PIG-L family deacetylase [Acidocella sp.]
MRAVVVAHPDDEALWLSSALVAAQRVVFCFGDQFGDAGQKSAARRRAVAALDLPGLVSLELVESGTRKQVDWAHTHFTAAGIKISDPAGQARYEANFAALLDGLRPLLAGCTEVYTHNPWGEYGHPEHVQVYRAVAALQAELGYKIWFSNYVSRLSWRLARHAGAEPCWADRVQTRPNGTLARRLFFTYLRHGAWTWPLAHRWPKREFFFSQPANSAEWRPLTGERLLDVQRLRLWRLGNAELVLI